MAYYSLKNLSHDQKLAEALGNMVVVWAYAELTLIGTLARVAGMQLNMSQAGYYRIPTFESRVKFIVSLIPEWNAAKFDKDAIAIAIEKLSKLASARNHWVHGDWCINPEKNETVIFNHRVPLDGADRRKPIKAADVENHCEAVSLRATTLHDLIDWPSIPL